MSWVDNVEAVIRNIAVPYGYTLAIWSAGMLAAGRCDGRVQLPPPVSTMNTEKEPSGFGQGVLLLILRLSRPWL